MNVSSKYLLIGFVYLCFFQNACHANAEKVKFPNAVVLTFDKGKVSIELHLDDSSAIERIEVSVNGRKNLISKNACGTFHVQYDQIFLTERHNELAQKYYALHLQGENLVDPLGASDARSKKHIASCEVIFNATEFVGSSRDGSWIASEGLTTAHELWGIK